MCGKAARFYREYKVAGDSFPPRFERRELRKMIMGRIDLNCVEVFGIERKHFLRRQFFGIERPKPVFVIPTGGPDMDPSRHFVDELSS